MRRFLVNLVVVAVCVGFLGVFYTYVVDLTNDLTEVRHGR